LELIKQLLSVPSSTGKAIRNLASFFFMQFELLLIIEQ